MMLKEAAAGGLPAGGSAPLAGEAVCGSFFALLERQMSGKGRRLAFVIFDKK